jgi:tetratricopeptide (TPR) repeat protein
MALFGVPAALENAPHQAINAAIEMRRRLTQLLKERRLSVPLDLHIGINTGLVIAGHVGGEVRQDFTVVGDTVNLASRLKDIAPHGAIYVGAETYRYVREEFEFRKLQPLTLKGKERPVDAYELLSDKERIHRAKPVSADRMISSPLVGREREIERLRACLAAVARGEGGIVNLIGEAGLGKSRLLAEALASEESKATTVVEGRSLSIGQNLRFHPFIDLLRHWAGIAESDEEPEARPKLEAAVQELFGDDAGENFPFVATLMGMRLSGAHAERVAGIQGEPLERLIAKSMRELFERIARARPLVLVFEDLHWADLSSIQLLESLLRLAPESAILFVHAFRPDHQDTSQRILRAAREHYSHQQIEIQLDSLDSRQCQALICNLLKTDQLPYAVVAHVARTAEGNPFYLEEVVRSLIDEGVVQPTKGQLAVTDKVHTVVIPDTIQGVVMARVDRLAASTRQILQVASVLGRSFPHRILVQVAPSDIDLSVELAQLKERQLLLERRTHRTSSPRVRTLAEETEYVFKHALVQETVYGSILQKTRKELHLRVAGAIEATFADRLSDFYGMLAYHFSRAESLEKAEEYLFLAGAEAARAAASSEALAFFREASKLYLAMHGEGGDPRKKALLEKNIALALLNKGDLTESIDHFDRALALLGVRPPRSALATGLRFAADLGAVLYRVYLRPAAHGSVGNLEHEREVLELYFYRGQAEITSDPRRLFLQLPTGLRRFNRTDPRKIDQACEMYVSCAGIFAYSGISFAISERMLDIARTLVREGSLTDQFAYRTMEFYHHYLKGNWDARFAVDPDLVERNLRLGQLWHVNNYIGLDCDQRLRKGDFEAARALLAKLVEINDVYGYSFAQSNHDGMTALLLLEERRLADALTAADHYQAGRHEDALRVFGLGTIAKVQILLGDRHGATGALAKAEEIVRRSGRVSPWHQSTYQVSRLLHDLAALEECLAHGDGSQARRLQSAARRSARRALGVVRKVAKDRTEAYRLVGRLCWLRGRQAQALTWWTRSVAEGERLGARPELARTYHEAGRALAESGGSASLNGLDASACLARARDVFSDLGLAWDLEQMGVEVAARAVVA